ncbi:pyruvate kinase [Nitzschia inconspicua]|uniref:pyruvate kinase n=1 Tax=Nitzschia inconspicua TaxID=303405 RepID=A0A9K3Q4H2_9STRA|nr:pyruvate kinase [Nitzschia inconspicua]
MSISNTSEVPLLAGGFITLGMVTAKVNTLARRTKIVCTIGPASWSEEGLGILMDAGMNIARLNFSHGSHENHLVVLERLRKVAAEKSRNIAVLLDTKGPEIRSGFFQEGIDKIELSKGQTLILTSDYEYKCETVIPTKLACTYDKIATSVTPGQQILVADGSLVLTVQSCNVAAGEVTCVVENSASIGERKNMNLPGVKVELPTFTDKDVDDIVNFGIKHGVEFIAASFVRTGQDVRNLRKLLVDNGGPHIKIICKIENQEGLENYDEILRETDAIMVARGDLGMEIPPSKVFLAQKFMIRKANIAGKPVITATQMLESMIKNPRPTRAECSDVANAVYDGTDAVMLSGESANSPYFEQAVHIMSRTVTNAEMSRNYNVLFQSIRNSIVNENGRLSVGESVASSAVKTAIDVQAKLIVIMSDTGKMANYVAKFRPAVSSLVLTPDLVVARQAHGLLLGMHSVHCDSLDRANELIEETMYELNKSGMMEQGDKIIFIAGRAASMKERLIITTLNEGKSYGRFNEDGGMFFNRGHILSFGTYDGSQP